MKEGGVKIQNSFLNSLLVMNPGSIILKGRNFVFSSSIESRGVEKTSIYVSLHDSVYAKLEHLKITFIF